MKKVFLLPLMLFGLVACGQQPAGKPVTVSLTSESLLGYDGSADVAYNSEESEHGVDGYKFGYMQLAAYRDEQGALRMRYKNGVGSYVYNKDAFKKNIKEIKITLSSAKTVYDNENVWQFDFGTSASGVSGAQKLSTVAGQLEYTVTPATKGTFFKMTKVIEQYTFYIASIDIVLA